jgi:hypothetical protein
VEESVGQREGLNSCDRARIACFHGSQYPRHAMQRCDVRHLCVALAIRFSGAPHVLHRRLVHRPVRAVETEKLYSQEKTAAREVFLRAVVVCEWKVHRS